MQKKTKHKIIQNYEYIAVKFNNKSNLRTPAITEVANWHSSIALELFLFTYLLNLNSNRRRWP